MPDTHIPLDGAKIRAFMHEVAEELPISAAQRTVIVVGGALLAWNQLRDSTRDVDSVTPIDEDLRAAAGVVAARHDLIPTWLNDAAAAFRPVTFNERQCTVLLEDPRLRVLGAPFTQVFLMKLYRVTAQDYDDLIRIWPLCTFDSPKQAADLFFEAYPHAPEDEHLAQFIAEIAKQASDPVRHQ
jgi:hypothetical protein